jgi:hypothetical protein
MRFLRLLIASFAIIAACSAQGPTPQLWYWHHTYLATDQAVSSSEALIDQAAAAGYTGVAFWDSSFSFMSDPFWTTQNMARMQTVMSYATSKGLKVMALGSPFGFSNDALQANPNFAESEAVTGSQFRVNSNASALQFINSFPGVINPGFESGQTGWFSFYDAGLSLDTSTAHTGNASAVITNAPANARLFQPVTLTPWRQYHLRLFYKTQNFRGSTQVLVTDGNKGNIPRLNGPFSTSANQGWTQLDYLFDSQTATQAYIYVGLWGGSSGSIWFDDIQLEETALLYTTRRPGTPVSMYDPANPTHIFQEGTDFNYITDPQMTSTRTPFTDQYHTVPTVTLPAGTHLAPGQTVAINSYSAFPAPGLDGMDMCLTEAGVLNWVTGNAQSIKSVLPPGAGIFMQYDEMRQTNNCFSCRSKNMTAGQLLAWSAGQSIQTYNTVMPGAPLYVWSDMFDPYHNAVNNYYDVQGDLSGSWTGLPSNVTIMNWNLGNLSTSLTWFSGKNSSQPTPHQQIIAGFYDSGNGGQAAQTELGQAAGIPGVQGLMYTTWQDDYSQLQSFASAARAGWAAYLTSVGGPTSSAGFVPPTTPVNLILKHSGKCLDVAGISKQPLAPTQQWSCNGGPNQQWVFAPVGDGSYTVTSVNSNMVLDVLGGPSSVAAGARLIQWPYANGSNEKWKLQQVSGGDITMTVENSGMCATVSGGVTATYDGAPMVQSPCVGADNQLFQIVAH